MQEIHFIGIGGVGMNGLAQLAALSGMRVTGSDRAYNPDCELFRKLDSIGISIFPQDGSGISETTTQVVFSTAIEKDNPDLIAANKRKLPLLHRADFLKELIGDASLIAVAGTAGKTTTTGLLGWIYESMGLNPTVYNGAAVLNWKTDEHPGNIRKGCSDLWIIEADESDRSFLTFHPEHAIITNISKDHYELDELHDMFNRFEEQTSGVVVRGPIDPAGHNDLSTGMMGRHNLENAASAITFCEQLGLERDSVNKAVSLFKGIERRLETVGSANGITVIDDYAHNPAKIAAAMEAVRERYPRVHAVWRPHGFTPLAQSIDELADVFADHCSLHGCTLHLLPVYYAGGTVQRSVSTEDLAERINSTGVTAALCADYMELEHKLEKCAVQGDAILLMGARDPELPRFARRLVDEWKTH